MSDKPGICDPWRVVEPVRAPIVPAPAALREHKRINLADQDFDADLKRPRTGLLDSKHGAIEVTNKQVDSDGSVLKETICCLFDLERHVEGASEAFSHGGIAFRMASHSSVGWDMQPGATYRSEEGFEPPVELRFLKQTLDHGMLRLMRILRDLQRRPGAGEILRKWGVRIVQR